MTSLTKDIEADSGLYLQRKWNLASVGPLFFLIRDYAKTLLYTGIRHHTLSYFFKGLYALRECCQGMMG